MASSCCCGGGRRGSGALLMAAAAAVTSSLRPRSVGARALSTSGGGRVDKTKSEQPPLELSPVQRTSLLTAFWRHAETEHTTPLIRDEPAGVLVKSLLPKETAEEWRASPLLQPGVDALAVRTRAVDDWLLESAMPMPTQKADFAEAGADNNAEEGSGAPSSSVVRKRQVVNLGAGMCSRPYRLDLPTHTEPEVQVRWFEVDDPALLTAKRSVLEDDAVVVPRVCSSANLIDVDGDVSDAPGLERALERSGLDPTVPTDWILEGLLEYLDPSDHGPLFGLARRLGGVGAEGAGAGDGGGRSSRLMVQVLEPSILGYLDSLGIDLPYRDLVPADVVVEELRQCGWTDVRVRREEDFVATYGRSPTVPGFCLIDAVADGCLS